MSSYTNDRANGLKERLSLDRMELEHYKQNIGQMRITPAATILKPL